MSLKQHHRQTPDESACVLHGLRVRCMQHTMQPAARERLPDEPRRHSLVTHRARSRVQGPTVLQVQPGASCTGASAAPCCRLASTSKPTHSFNPARQHQPAPAAPPPVPHAVFTMALHIGRGQLVGGRQSRLTACQPPTVSDSRCYNCMQTTDTRQTLLKLSPTRRAGRTGSQPRHTHTAWPDTGHIDISRCK
jgi:hypothetical protein